MKYIIGLIFTLNIYGVAMMAQVPPPPPLIYKAPEKNELKEFVSEDERFEITFPGIPKIAKFEKLRGEITTYIVNRKGSSSSVEVAQFDISIEDKKEKFYGLFRQTQIETPKTKIEAERDIKFNGVEAKEFDILQDYNYQRVRIVIVGQRAYELFNDITNWHILTEYNKAKVDEFNKETERFFNSFKILK